MTATTPVLTDSKTLNEVVKCLTENIPIKAQGKCEQKNIFEILIRLLLKEIVNQYIL
jgi:putative transposase